MKTHVARGSRLTTIALPDGEFLASSATASLQKGVRADLRRGLGLPARSRQFSDRGKTAGNDLAKPDNLMAGNTLISCFQRAAADSLFRALPPLL